MYKLYQRLIQMQEEQKGRRPRWRSAMEKRAQNQAWLHRSGRTKRGRQAEVAQDDFWTSGNEDIHAKWEEKEKTKVQHNKRSAD